jgi:competence protein ComEA
MPSLPVSRRRALVLAAAALLLLAVAGRTLAGAGAAAEQQPAAELVAEPRTAAPRLVVHVAGAVHEPGLYRLAEGSRVADAVARAGGAAASADTSAINLAAPLLDGMQVVVPARVEVAASGAASGAAAGGDAPAAASARVSLSSATVEELDALPGIGPVTAQKIVDHRAAHGGFRSVDDLDAIPGIGPARVEQLRELVTP